VIPAALKQLPCFAAHDYGETAASAASTAAAAAPKVAAAAPAPAAAAVGSKGQAGPSPRASFDLQPLAAPGLPNLAGLNLGPSGSTGVGGSSGVHAGVGGAAGLDSLIAGGPPPLRLGAMGGPPPLRPAGVVGKARAAAAAPAGHHQEFLFDPVRTAEQQDK
jgi:hypothetical protein